MQLQWDPTASARPRLHPPRRRDCRLRHEPPDQCRKLTPRYLARAEGAEVLRLHLAVDHPESPGVQLPDDVHERDLRGIRPSRKHGFAEKRLPDRYAVEAARQLAA